MINFPESNVSIEWARTKIRVPHGQDRLVAAHPLYESLNLLTVRNAIRADGLRESTAPEVISFLHAMNDHNSTEGNDVTSKMEDYHFVAFTGILYHPGKKIVAFIDYPEFEEDGRVSKQDLLKRLGDNNIRTAPLSDIKKGRKISSQIPIDPYYVGLFGEEGAQKAGEFSDRHPSREGYLWLPSIGKEPIATVAAFGSRGERYGVGVVGNREENGYGQVCAFGVFD